jgi:hypothetical protein
MMMTQTEALRLALEALEYMDVTAERYVDKQIPEKAITAIKAALEAKDEPWEQFYPEMGKPKLAYLSPTESPENACYIPPQRTWVGLTDKDWNRSKHNYDFQKGVDWAESILKEKNA